MSPRVERARYDALPSRTEIRDRDVEIDYDVEEVDGRSVGVARLRLPEKIARSLTASEVPTLDRPVRFVVLRGQRGSVRARTLDELQALLDAPWTEEEVARFNRKRDEQREAARGGRHDRTSHAPKRGLREGRGATGRPGKRERGGGASGGGRPDGGRPGGGRSGGGRGRSR